MFGAILGDIIGCPFEFDRGNKSKDFELFSRSSTFTDDSIMTIAVFDALRQTAHDADDETIRRALVKSMLYWGRKNPYAGYGASFLRWLREDDPKPYNSCGNGSAMRVSCVGWLYETLEETRHIARLTADVSHNHPEGIKGAEAIASAIWLARNGSSKQEIRDYMISEFGYNLSRTCDEIRPGYRHVETCQETVPEALTAFFEGEDFVDVIRTAVSLGGDCDTLTDIAAAVGEAYFGVPGWLRTECFNRLPQEMAALLALFEQKRIPAKG